MLGALKADDVFSLTTNPSAPITGKVNPYYNWSKSSSDPDSDSQENKASDLNQLRH